MHNRVFSDKTNKNIKKDGKPIPKNLPKDTFILLPTSSEKKKKPSSRPHWATRCIRRWSDARRTWSFCRDSIRSSSDPAKAEVGVCFLLFHFFLFWVFFFFFLLKLVFSIFLFVFVLVRSFSWFDFFVVGGLPFKRGHLFHQGLWFLGCISCSVS